MADEDKGSEGGAGAASEAKDEGVVSLEEMLRYDPFSEKKGGESEEGEEGESEEGEAGEEASASEAAGEAAEDEGEDAGKQKAKPAPGKPRSGEGEEGAASAQPGSTNSEVEYLRRQLADALRLLERKATQRPEQRPEQEKGKEREEDLPPYDFHVPDQLLDMLGSENPGDRRKAIGVMLKGVALTVHKNVRAEMAAAMRELPRHVESTVASTQAMQSAAQDFYSTYRGLDKPALKNLVRDVGIAVAQERGDGEWTPALRDAIATRVCQELGWSVERAKGMQERAAPRAPARKPPATIGSSPRPAQKPSVERDVQDLLF